MQTPSSAPLIWCEDRFSLLLFSTATAKNDHAQKQRRHYGTNNANHARIHTVISLSTSVFRFWAGFKVPVNARKDQMLLTIGINSRTMRTAIGPTVTTKRDGMIQKKIGKISLTPSLAAFSSAI